MLQSGHDRWDRRTDGVKPIYRGVIIITSFQHIEASYYLPVAPFTNIVLTLIPAWINNHIHYKVWDETVQLLKFKNG